MHKVNRCNEFEYSAMGRLFHRTRLFRHTFLLKVLFSLTILVSLISVVVWITSPDTTAAKRCFGFNIETEPNYPAAGTVNWFEDVVKSPRQPRQGKTIFFHETSCYLNGEIHLNARQACAIESAAKENPNWDVFVLFASPVGYRNDSTPLPPIISALKTYSNIHMRNVNLWTYAAGTPIDEWLWKEELFLSKYLNSHVSDFLRYLSLYKYGGTYMDLDVVVQKNLDLIEPNYSGAESKNYVAAGVISFDHNGIGREIAELCLNEFQETFNGADWGNNGPGVITRVLQRVCRTKNPELMTRKQCRGFKVYPPSGFYAVPWENWHVFFDPSKTSETLQRTKDSIAIHVWNMHSKKEVVRVGSNVAYGVVADQHCPKVYHSCGEIF